MSARRTVAESAVRFAALTDSGDARLAELHREVLVPSFAPDELDSLAELREGLDPRADPASGVLVALDPDDRVVAGAVTMRYRGSPVVLLAYFAVRPGLRGGGIGTGLLARLAAGFADDGVALVVGEVEDPRGPALVAGQDPVGRLRFYERAGARLLPVRFVQPALGAGRERVRGMLLLTFYADPEFTASGAVPAPLVGDFVRRYFTSTEGIEPPFDGELQALLDEFDRAGRLPLLPVGDYARAVPAP